MTDDDSTNQESLKFFSWERKAKECWSKRTRPDATIVLSAFPDYDRDTAELLVETREFEIAPDTTRLLSIAFYCLKPEILDFYLFSFLRGSLLDRKKADVVVGLIASSIAASEAQQLASRFSKEELELLKMYFLLMQERRGWATKVEAQANETVCRAIR